jgi:protein-S-isoprenylcysteine O-methyltransferase Ste14
MTARRQMLLPRTIRTRGKRRVMPTTVIIHLCFYALLLFGGAGRLDWPAGWAFLALYAIQMLTLDIGLSKVDPDLVQERRRPGRATAAPGWDRRFLIVSALVGPSWILFMALDAGRFGWSPLPVAAAVPGGGLMLLGTYVAYAGLRANHFASVIVRMQPDRGHHVVDRGPYAVVRHPIYAGALLTTLGAPLVLGSLWGLIGSAVLIALTGRRAVLEERFLADQLPGYRDYARRIRWRIIPGLF